MLSPDCWVFFFLLTQIISGTVFTHGFIILQTSGEAVCFDFSHLFTY